MGYPSPCGLNLGSAVRVPGKSWWIVHEWLNLVNSPCRLVAWANLLCWKSHSRRSEKNTEWEALPSLLPVQFQVWRNNYKFITVIILVEWIQVPVCWCRLLRALRRGSDELHCWDREFDSRWGHGCLSHAFVACRVGSSLCECQVTRSGCIELCMI